jgi:hypothetical protein
MGREIRRVPISWEHPRDRRGNYIPLYDETYERARETWLDGLQQWLAGTHPELLRSPELSEMDYWEWCGGPPDRESYRPRWTDDQELGYQIYETVSEGTPVSPVFPTTEALVGWLLKNGHSEQAARRFIEWGSVPSLIVVRDGAGRAEILSDIEVAEAFGANANPNANPASRGDGWLSRSARIRAPTVCRSSCSLSMRPV